MTTHVPLKSPVVLFKDFEVKENYSIKILLTKLLSFIKRLQNRFYRWDEYIFRNLFEGLQAIRKCNSEKGNLKLKIKYVLLLNVASF